MASNEPSFLTGRDRFSKRADSRLRRREFLLGALLPLTACSRSEVQSEHAKALVDVLQRQIPILMDQRSVPGLSLAILENGRVVAIKAFGVVDRESMRPVTEETVFEAASLSKPVFAYAVLKLCEKGVLDLDTPLTKYTPERFLKDDPRLDKITARHALSHTSGFQNWRSDAEPLKISFEPGEKWQYSGEGYSYLQSVLTRLVGMPIDPYMRANVLAPLGMASSGYVWNDFFEKNMARPHDTQGVPFANKKSNEQDVARYASAGALLSTPADYAKFLIEVLSPKPADQYRLSRKSLDEMVRPQIALKDEFGSSWALGWRIFPQAAGDAIWHGGDNDGFHSVAAASLRSKSGYVVMTNGENGADLIQELAVKVLNPFLTASYPH